LSSLSFRLPVCREQQGMVCHLRCLHSDTGRLQCKWLIWYLVPTDHSEV
jgi:hypothetical protein